MDLLAAAKSPDTQPPLRCTCPPHWTGDRCEQPRNLCERRCYNGGTCYLNTKLIGSSVSVAQCQCPAPFSGTRCENCPDLICVNGGICSMNNNNEAVCRCPLGYHGRLCDLSVCGKFGTAVQINNNNNNNAGTATGGGVRCNCFAGYSGKKCELNSCDQYCLNGGTCRVDVVVVGGGQTTKQQPKCVCPTFYEGRQCEIDRCRQGNDGSPPTGCPGERLCDCQNNGTCTRIHGKDYCKCLRTWGGEKCEVNILLIKSNK